MRWIILFNGCTMHSAWFLQGEQILEKSPLSLLTFVVVMTHYWYVTNEYAYYFQVLQRKTEEAAMATKRLKELLEARKSSSRDTSGINCY